MTESARVKELEKELAQAHMERDLAISHDRQPYPTQWAYDQACKALEKAKSDRDAQAALVERMREALKFYADCRKCGGHGYTVEGSQDQPEKIQCPLCQVACEALEAPISSALQEFKERCWKQAIEETLAQGGDIENWSNEMLQQQVDEIVAELKKEGR